MAAPTYNDIYKFSRTLQHISQEARSEFQKLLSEVDFSDWSIAANQLRTLIQGIVSRYGLASAEIGAQWYEYCRKMNFDSRYTAIVGEVSRYSVSSDVNAEIDKLFNGEVNEAELVSLLSGAVVDQVQKQARDTILSNLNAEYLDAIARGDKSFASKCGYARVTTGDSCAFCIMLASRGFVYASERTATKSKRGDKYHNHCHCVAVPFAKADSINGYEKTLYKHKQMYHDADNLRRSGNYPDELRERIDAAKANHSGRWDALNEIMIIMRYQTEGLS